MVVSKLYRLRVEVKQLLEVAKIHEDEKKKWRKNIPRMIPSELVELKLNLLEQLINDAQTETISEIREGKDVPEDDEGLLEVVLAKVLEKADRVEERTRSAYSGQAKRVVGE
jgi:hypothetical protein